MNTFDQPRTAWADVEMRIMRLHRDPAENSEVVGVDDDCPRVEAVDLSDHGLREAYFRFRTHHFGTRLGWAVLNEIGIDQDELDPVSAHFCLRRVCGEVVGCIRLTPPTGLKWMMQQSPFDEMIDRSLDPAYPKSFVAEVSRFGIDPRFATATYSSGYSAGQALRRAAYSHSLKLGLRYWYVVAYKALIGSLQRRDHLPFRIISPAIHFDDKAKTCIACLDLAEAYVHMARRAPKFLDWNNACVSMTELAVLMDRNASAMAA